MASVIFLLAFIFPWTLFIDAPLLKDTQKKQAQHQLRLQHNGCFVLISSWEGSLRLESIV